jgi:2-polyprenyl-3-methyl-5-hydroxy-6-metoxy-1,4-benzoquinol methylase
MNKTNPNFAAIVNLPWFDDIVQKEQLHAKDGHWVSVSGIGDRESWSFSEEWSTHAETGQQKTWDWTADERLQLFFKETKTEPSQLPGKLVLDAGCGNGQLTRAIASAGAYVVGIDKQAHLPNGDDRCQFVQCDFDDPPFWKESFDIIIANGSIHHTKNTFQSFQALASLVKQGGKIYVWVYKKQTGFKRILTAALDFFRFFISRFPSRLQRFIVNRQTDFFYLLSRVRKGENSKRSKEEIRINIYDAFTPRYRHYHTREEVAKWFKQCGFDRTEVTHDNNRYGFGMVGLKERS